MESTVTFPVSLDEALSARDRIAPYLMPTPLRNYRELDEFVGKGIRVLVKHENHQPINSFKIRNALSAMSALAAGDRARGVIGATRGNHGLGMAHAGALLGVRVTVVVPIGNNPEKNSAMRALGARLIEYGNSYDESVVEADRLCREEGLTLIHSTNDRNVLAGASTMTLEILDQANDLDSMVFAIGGGSQATGALSLLSVLRPEVKVYGVQAEGASACYQSWKAQSRVPRVSPNTIADGIATGDTYEMTFPALRDGLAGFVLVSDDDIIEATRALVKHTHNLAEPAGATGLAGLLKLREELNGQTVCIVLSGSNIDAPTLSRVLA